MSLGTGPPASTQLLLKTPHHLHNAQRPHAKSSFQISECSSHTHRHWTNQEGSTFLQALQITIVILMLIRMLLMTMAIQLYENHIDGFVPNCSMSSALDTDIVQSCTKPSKWWPIGPCWGWQTYTAPSLSRHRKSFRDRVSESFIYGYPIIKLPSSL